MVYKFTARAKKAIDLAHADGKKTIKVEHIKLAKKLLCQ